ncbi:hypothetical protein Ddye_000505 [Dipteronia dyeriana]|uniref:Ubiquitin-like protease family profile domain-containing protein n=1 Tax=Dipteronia dyeriana TaxID=168575 RepID=A0AAE0CSM1_9ROSI|nr:hypothetical protein Ddye_000505 [Dipteronia dyeriana]
MTNRLRESLKTPEEEWYEGKVTRHDHFDALGQIDDVINWVPAEWAEEDRRRLRASYFGHLLTMQRPVKFSSGIIHQLLLREVHHNGSSDEMRFMIGTHKVRFSKVEFVVDHRIVVRRTTGYEPMFARTKLVATQAERGEPYYAGIEEVIPDPLGGRQEGIPDSLRASPSDTDAIPEVKQRRVSEEMHTNTELPRERPWRQRRLRFTMTKHNVVDSSRGDTVGACERSDEERNRQHQQLKDLVQALWGSTSQTAGEGSVSHDRDDSYRDVMGGRSPIEGTDSAKDVGGMQGTRPETYGTVPNTQPDHLTRSILLPPSAASSHGIPPPPTVIAGSSHRIPHPPIDTPGSSHEVPHSPTDTPRSSYGISCGLRIPVRHMDAYLAILRKRQRAYPTLYNQRINILGTQFFPLLEYQWEKIMPHGADGEVNKLGWKVLQYRWSTEDLITVCGFLPAGTQPWLEVDMGVPVSIRKRQVRLLKWFLPSMLHQSGFHDDRPPGMEKFKKENRTFKVSLLSKTALPQQHKSGNCGAHTLRLIEYILADKIQCDWIKDDMPTIREKMAVEVFCNSQPQI